MARGSGAGDSHSWRLVPGHDERQWSRLVPGHDMRRRTGDHRRQHQGGHGAVGSLAVHSVCGLDLCELWRFVLPPQQGLWSDLEQQRGVETAVLEVHAIVTAVEKIMFGLRQSP